MSVVRSLRLVIAAAVAALILLAVVTASAQAQRCNADAGCSNGVKPNYWLPSSTPIGKGKATGYVTFHGEYFYGEYYWYDYPRPGGGVDRYCGFAGEQIACPR